MPDFDPSSSSSSSLDYTSSQSSSTSSSLSYSSESESWTNPEFEYYDHGGNNWIINEDVEVWGIHYNINTFVVEKDKTLSVSTRLSYPIWGQNLQTGGYLTISCKTAIIFGHICGIEVNKDSALPGGYASPFAQSTLPIVHALDTLVIGGYGYSGQYYLRNGIYINTSDFDGPNAAIGGNFRNSKNTDLSTDTTNYIGGNGIYIGQQWGDDIYYLGGGAISIYADESIEITGEGVIATSDYHIQDKICPGGIMLWSEQIAIRNGAIVYAKTEDYSGATVKFITNNLIISDVKKESVKQNCGRLFIRGEYLRDGLEWGNCVSKTDIYGHSYPTNINKFYWTTNHTFFDDGLEDYSLRWNDWTLEGTTTPAANTGGSGSLKVGDNAVVSGVIDLMGAVGETMTLSEQINPSFIGSMYTIKWRGWTQEEADNYNNGNEFSRIHDETEELSWEVYSGPLAPNWRYMQIKIMKG